MGVRRYSALSDVVRPGLMVPHLAPDSRGREGETLRLLEAGMAAEFFQAFMVLDCPCRVERRQIASACAAEDAALTYCLVRALNERGLNLSALDEPARQAAVDEVVARLDEAQELAAALVQIISGPAPDDPALRGEALRHLADSVDAICQAAGPALAISIEPLDVGANKRQTLGYTNEALELAEAVDGLAISLDTSHMLLNGENITEALEAAGDRLGEFHICNCATDPASPFYGDLHVLALGPPGRLTVGDAADILAFGVERGVFTPERRIGLFYEVTNEMGDAAAAVEHNRQTLLAIWETICGS
jgi:sugar phosphate isomerase/epimerase